MTMTRRILAGSTDVSVVIRIIDSTDGTPETGVVFNTAGIDLEYRREGAASVDITEATLAALTTAHTDGGFLAIGNGYYRLDLPDAACASGVTGVLVHGTVTGMVVIGTYIELVAYNPYDSIRLGLTALPNAAAEAAGGLYTRGTGAGQINQAANGQVDSNAVALSGDSVAADNLESEYDGTGYGHILQRTTIATLASQVSFTLTAGSADNDAYNGCIIVIQDVSTAAQKAVGVISDYTGSTKTVTLLNDPAVFTIATTDIVTIIADRALKATVDNRTLDVSSGGEAGLDWANIGSPTTAQNLSATNIDVDQVVASVSGAVGSVTAGVNVTQLGGVAQSLTDLKDFADDGYDPATNKVQGVVLVDTLTTYTGNTPQTGDSFARIGATGSGLTSLSTQTSVNTIDDFLDTEIAAIKAVTDALPNAGALTTIQSDLDDIQTRLPAALTSGTSDSGTTTTMVDAARTEADTDYWKGLWIRFTSGNISGQVRLITGFTPASDTITFAPATTQAVGTHTYEILPANRIDLGQWLGSTPNALVSSRVDASVGAMATDVLTAAALNADAVTEIQAGLATAAALDTVDNFLDTEIAAIISTLGTPAGASISADLAAIEAQTDDIGTAGAGLTAIPWNAAWDTEVQSEVDDALVAQNLDHLVKIAVDTDFATTVHLNSVIGQIADNGTSATFDRTTDSLEALEGKINTIDDFVDTEVATIITTLGTPAGASLAADIAAIEAQTDDIGVAGAGLTAVPWNSNWDAEVQSEVDDAIVARNLDKLIIVSGTADSGTTTTMVDAARTEADADYWKGRLLLFTSGNISGQCAIITDFVVATDTFTFAPPLTQAVGTQTYVILPGISVWDDTLAEHLISGSTGSALNAAGAAGDPWSTALPGAYGAGTAGKIVGDNVNATISSRATQSSVDTIDDFLDTEIAAIKAKTDQLTFTTANKVDATIQAAGDFAQAAADKVWSTAARTLTAFGFSVTVGTNNDKTGYSLSAAGVQAIWDALTSALTTASSVGKLLVDNINATISSRSSHSAADVWSVATRILTAGTNIVLAKGTGVTGFNDLSAAQVNTEVDSALVDIRLDELLSADSDIDGAAPPTVGSVFHELLTKTTGSFTYDQATDSLEAIRDRGDTAWTTATGFSTLDAAGVRSAVGLASANLDTQLTTIDDFLDTEIAAIKAKTDNLPSDPADESSIQATLTTLGGYIDTEVAAILAAVDTEIAAIKAKTDNLPASPAATGDIPTAAAIADANWDELRSGHSISGSYGESFFTLESGAAIAGTLSTTQMSTNLTEATDDHYNGRIIIWLTGTLVRQATDITDYNGTTKVLTYTAVTEAPVATDRFVIV